MNILPESECTGCIKEKKTVTNLSSKIVFGCVRNHFQFKQRKIKVSTLGSNNEPIYKGYFTTSDLVI